RECNWSRGAWRRPCTSAAPRKRRRGRTRFEVRWQWRWRREQQGCWHGSVSWKMRPRGSADLSRLVIGAPHAACTTAYHSHHAEAHPPVWSVDLMLIFESKVLRRPIRLCAIATKLQWLAKTIPRLLRVRHANRAVCSHAVALEHLAAGA